MDDKIEMLEAELDWLHDEIAEHQEYELRLQETIRELQLKLDLYEEVFLDPLD